MEYQQVQSSCGCIHENFNVYIRGLGTEDIYIDTEANTANIMCPRCAEFIRIGDNAAAIRNYDMTVFNHLNNIACAAHAAAHGDMIVAQITIVDGARDGGYGSDLFDIAEEPEPTEVMMVENE